MDVRFELKEVSKTYRQRSRWSGKTAIAALDRVNLTLYDRQVNALVGPSGGGKSTLARILMGFERCDSGQIIYQRASILQTPGREFRRQNQLVSQNPLLSVNPCFKVEKIMAEPLLIRKRGQGEIKEKISQLLNILDLPPSLLHRYPHEISAGQLQRVVLARGLILEPEFLILDEPFSCLDQITANRLMKHLQVLLAGLTIGVLFISHHLAQVKTLAQHVALIKNGRISFQGSCDVFFRHIMKEKSQV